MNTKQERILRGYWSIFIILSIIFTIAPVSAQSNIQNSALSFESLLEADRNVTLTARTTGIIKKIRIKEGKQVSTGDTMIVLEDDAELAEYKRAKARLEYAKTTFAADKKLFDKEAISHIKYLDGKLKYVEAEAVMKRAELNLKKTRIIAPFDGVVTINEQSIEVGHLVPVNSPICSVVKFEPLKIIIYLPEQHSDRFNIGAKAEITSRYKNYLRAEAVVVEKSPVIDPASSTIKLKLVVQSNPGGLIPGMHVIVVLMPAPY